MSTRLVHGPSFDEPVVWYEGAGTSDRRWLVQDQLGSVIAVTNASGDAIAINSYDEYGRPAAANQGRFQYTGQTWLSEASLYHYKARAYSPVLGRFMQTDPILYAGGMNLYAYVGSDPVNGIDPTGEIPHLVLIGMGCGVSAVVQYVGERSDDYEGEDPINVGIACVTGALVVANGLMLAPSWSLYPVSTIWMGVTSEAVIILSGEQAIRANNAARPLISANPFFFTGSGRTRFMISSDEWIDADLDDNGYLTSGGITITARRYWAEAGYGQLRASHALIPAGHGAAVLDWLTRSNERRLRERVNPELVATMVRSGSRQ